MFVFPQCKSIADPRGSPGKRLPLGPVSFIFMQLSTKIFPNNRFSDQTSGLAPPSGKPWIRRWLLLDVVTHEVKANNFFANFIVTQWANEKAKLFFVKDFVVCCQPVWMLRTQLKVSCHIYNVISWLLTEYSVMTILTWHVGRSVINT